MQVTCPTCLGKGYISNPDQKGTAATIHCRSCHGTGWVERSELYGGDKYAKET